MNNIAKISIYFVAMILVLSIPVQAMGQGNARSAPSPSIVDVAISVNEETGEFSTLIAAVLAADPAVLATLSGRGQFTVFAPTDAAFAELSLDADNIAELPQKALTDILLYHVARGNRDSGDVLASSRIRMLNGQFVFQNAGVLNEDVNIIATDVPAANGVIHVIDSVLLPN